MQEAILNLFPFIFYLFWDENGKLLRLKFNFSYNLKPKIIHINSKKALKFTKKFYKSFLRYWNFEKNFVDVPHLIKTTEFEAAVLKELRKLNIGEIINYKELARRAGYPKAYRAVGRVMSKNPLPLVYPCHRVIGVKRLTGYSQGLLLKYFLICREINSGFDISQTFDKKFY